MNRKIIENLNILAMILPLVGLLIFSNNILVYGLIIALQIVMVFINGRKYSNILSSNFLNSKIILLICIILIVSMFLIVINGNSIEIFKTTILVMISLIIEMLLYISDKKRTDTFKSVLNYIVTITIFLCIYSIILRICGNQHIIRITENEYKQIWNIKGIVLSQSACGDPIFGFTVGSLTKNPNSLSYLCLFSLIINLTKKNESNKKNILSILILLAGLFVSGSRMAITLLPIIYILYFVYKKQLYKNRIIIFMFEILIIVSICFLLLNMNLIVEKINLNGRLRLWETTLEKINFIGRGVGADNALIIEKLGIRSSMHNSYLSFIINYGYIFFTFFMFFNIITLLKKKNEIYNDEKITSYILYISLLIISLVESTFFVFGAYQYLFFYCLFNLYTIEKETNK